MKRCARSAAGVRGKDRKGPRSGVVNVSGLIAAGAQQADALGITLTNGQSGVNNATVTISSQSNGAGTSGLGTTNLADSQVNVQAIGYNYAKADLQQSSGLAQFTGSGNSYKLDFGAVDISAGAQSDSLDLLNEIQLGGSSLYTDLLSGDFTVSGSGFDLSGFSDFSNIAGGDSLQDLLVSLDPSQTGSYQEFITFNLTSSIAGSWDLGPITLELDAQVAPEPASIALFASGMGGVFWARRRRQNSSSTHLDSGSGKAV